MRSKYLLIILFLSFTLFHARSQSISLNYNNIKVAALLDSIQLKSDVGIAYDVNAVPVDSIVSVNIAGQHPHQVISELLKDYPLAVTLINGQIVISEKPVESKTNRFIRIGGVVRDGKTDARLPLVNISLKGKALGTITNMSGDFEFVIPKRYSLDSLAFSCMGYATQVINLPRKDTVLNVRLLETSVKLKEVEVKYEDVDAIMEQVVYFRGDNYWDEKVLLTGFFREAIKQDDQFVQVSEAIVEIYKTEYTRPHGVERVRFIKGRKKNELSPMDNVHFKLEGGPYYFSRLDVAKYLDFFPDDKQESLYKYTYNGVDVYNDEVIYRIGFKPIDDDGQLLYQGELLIHSTSYAILSASFELTKKSIRRSKRSIIRKSSKSVKAKPLEASYLIDYRPYQGKWILNKVRGRVRVHITDKKNRIDSEFDAVTEMLISDLNTEGVERFKLSETFKAKYVLAEEIKEEDISFWDNYNIIKPDEEIEKVFKQPIK